MADQFSADPRIGTELAGYRIERLLGRGGMGVVYLAEDQTLARRVALKVLSPELSEDTEFRERFRAEWRLAASIDHPNVIPIYEAGDYEGTLFIAMRFVDGTDLKRLIAEEGALGPERAVALVAQVAAGLDEAHERGLVHRDVKPSNVLVTGEGLKEHAYLADFGLTKPVSDEAAAMESIGLSGSFDYVSPEQIGGGQAGPASDLYALGAVLYESLTGQVPFPRGGGPFQIAFAHVNDEPPAPTDLDPDLPAGLDAVVARAMAKDSEQRYASGAELAAAARGALPRRGRLGGKRLAAVGVLVVVVVAAAVVASVLVAAGGGSEPLSIESESLVLLDGDGEISGLAPVGSGPPIQQQTFVQRISPGEGTVWVTNPQDDTVASVDSTDLTARRTVAVSGAPTDIAVDESTVWVTSNPRGEGRGLLSQVDQESGRVRRTIDTGLRSADLVVASGGLWVAGDDGSLNDALVSVDPGTGQIGWTTPLGGRALDLVDAAGSLWALARVGFTGGLVPVRLLRVDPASGEIVTALDLPESDSYAPLVVHDGKVWTSYWAPSEQGQALISVDPSDEEKVEIATLPEIATISRFALDDDCAWFATDTESIEARSPKAQLLCVDLDSLEITRRIELPTSAARLRIEDLIADDQGLWITATPNPTAGLPFNEQTAN